MLRCKGTGKAGRAERLAGFVTPNLKPPTILLGGGGGGELRMPGLGSGLVILVTLTKEGRAWIG